MPIVKHAVIAAAGIGSRLGFGYPKCLMEFGGKPLVHHLLERLSHVDDVRVVVGFMAEDVMDCVRTVRSDVIFVHNHSYRTTTTLSSYVQGAAGIDDPVLYMDADIYFNPNDFANFLKRCEGLDESLIAITRANTKDCVFVRCDDKDQVISFSREEVSSFEWANLAWLPHGVLVEQNTAVFERLAESLPIQTCKIICHEVDTPEDHARLVAHFSNKY